MTQKIIVKGARMHNLQNIDIKVPRNKITCFVGVSGSGKSSVAFDIIAQEGQRQYFESLSSFARRYLPKSTRPNVDYISGISPTIVIKQERLRGSSRSTVGTLTEAYTYLRILYSRSAKPVLDSSYYSFNHPHGACTKCKGIGMESDFEVDKIIDFDKTLNNGAIALSEYKINSRRWNIIKQTGLFDMNKKIVDYSPEELNMLLYSKPERYQDLKAGFVQTWSFEGVIHSLKRRQHDSQRKFPQRFKQYMSSNVCSSCHGARLKSQSLQAKICSYNISELSKMTLDQLVQVLKSFSHPHAQEILPRLLTQLRSLQKVGLGYLSLDRSIDTLSGGEAQRTKLSKHLNSNLVEMIYVFDEPTAGLHPRDIDQVINNLATLKENGSTVIVIEHDPMVIKSADYLVELGPGGGRGGGKVIYQGPLKNFPSSTPTGQFVQAQAAHKSNQNPKHKKSNLFNNYLPINDANRYNLKNVSTRIPLNCLVTITGVSGAGKSSFVQEIKKQSVQPISVVTQKPIGKSSRSIIATYLGIFDDIRKMFAQANEVSTSLFSFNSHGACPKCKGLGVIKMEMNFLGDIEVLCNKCQGKRYTKKILKYKYNGYSIDQVLNMSVQEALTTLKHNIINTPLKLLSDIGLDYITLGQPLTTISGGESQRLKLASKLNLKDNIFILDEPTSGLHPLDVTQLLKVIFNLICRGNSVIVIEHNLDIISQSDWIIDLGPEGGNNGGRIVAEGQLNDILKCQTLHTAKALHKYLKN